jgi:hypothetical protein
MQEVCAVSRRASAAGPALLANFNAYARASLVAAGTAALVANGAAADDAAAAADEADTCDTADVAAAAAEYEAEANYVSEAADEGANTTGAADSIDLDGDGSTGHCVDKCQSSAAVAIEGTSHAES